MIGKYIGGSEFPITIPNKTIDAEIKNARFYGGKLKNDMNVLVEGGGLGRSI